MSSDLTQLVKKRGCAVIRQVFTLEQVNEWNEQIVKYIESNQYYDKEIEKRGLDQYFSQLASGRPQIFGCIGPNLKSKHASLKN